MKKLIKNTLFATFSILFFVACNDDVITSEPNVEALTTEETVEILTENISLSSDGMLMDIQVTTEILPMENLDELSTTNALSDFCGESQTHSDSSSFDGPNVQWSHSWVLSRTLVCDDNDTPQYFDVDFDAEGAYASNQIEASREAVGDWQVTRAEEFSQENQVLVFNGEYQREIERDQVNGDRGHEITLVVEAFNVKRNRTTGEFVSGTLTFTKSGMNNNGQSFSRSGTIVINDDCTATVTMENGNVFTIEIC